MTEVHVYIDTLSAGISTRGRDKLSEAQLILADESQEDTAIVIHTNLTGLQEIMDAISSHLDQDRTSSGANMKLYKISQTVNNTYDTYDSAVVVAEDEDQARRIYPDEGKGDFHYTYIEELGQWYMLLPESGEPSSCSSREWAPSPKDVQVQYIGEAESSLQAGVICASFNAG